MYQKVLNHWTLLIGFRCYAHHYIAQHKEKNARTEIKIKNIDLIKRLRMHMSSCQEKQPFALNNRIANKSGEGPLH